MENDFYIKSEINNFFSTLYKNPELALGIVNSIPAGISIAVDKTCREIRHNKKAAELLRIKPGESLSLTYSSFGSPLELRKALSEKNPRNGLEAMGAGGYLTLRTFCSGRRSYSNGK
ncbi:MAG: hypothetical protein WC364_06500 [Eubacteriales bacterium]